MAEQPAIRRSPTRLADGRRLVYFDELPAPARRLDDPRPLSAVGSTSQLRYDPLLDDWVVIAGHRQDRTFQPPAEQCPLCPSAPGRPTEIPAEDYQVVVFENRFPALAMSAVEPAPPAGDDPLLAHRPGVGRCEVVCFTSDHVGAFSRLSPARVRTVMHAWADRTAELSELPGVEYVFVFENRGEEIGVTLAHPHGQIYGYPFVPPRIRRRLDVARRHRERTGDCLSCAVLAAERRAGSRVVAGSAQWTAYVPAAARWPYEVHLVPHRHAPDLPALSRSERADFAEVYLDVLDRFDGLFDGPTPYIAAWQQAPVHGERELAHVSLQLFTVRRAPDKLKFLAGSESGVGVFVNDIPPEVAADRLRSRP